MRLTIHTPRMQPGRNKLNTSFQYSYALNTRDRCYQIHRSARGLRGTITSGFGDCLCYFWFIFLLSKNPKINNLEILFFSPLDRSDFELRNMVWPHDSFLYANRTQTAHDDGAMNSRDHQDRVVNILPYRGIETKRWDRKQNALTSGFSRN